MWRCNGLLSKLYRYKFHILYNTMMWSSQLSLLPSAGWEMSSSLRLQGEGLVWLIGAVVCLLAANRGSNNCSLTRAMDGRIVRRVIICSCQSAATSETANRFWPGVSRVRSVAASSLSLWLKVRLPGARGHRAVVVSQRRERRLHHAAAGRP